MLAVPVGQNPPYHLVHFLEVAVMLEHRAHQLADRKVAGDLRVEHLVLGCLGIVVAAMRVAVKVVMTVLAQLGLHLLLQLMTVVLAAQVDARVVG